MSKTFLEIAVIVLVPVCSFSLNWSVRSSNNYVLSAAADFILALVAFDLTALASYSAFKKVVSDSALQDWFGLVFVGLFCVTVLAWLWFFLPLEQRMVRGYSYDEGRYVSNKPTGIFVLSSVAVAVLLAFHIFPFVYGG